VTIETAMTEYTENFENQKNPNIGNHLRQNLSNRFKSPRVLELGTLQSIPGRSTMHKDWIPHFSEYLGTDIQAGEDVDIVADAHKLSSVVGESQFDIIMSCSTFEHLKYPHLAGHEIMKVLKPNGLVFIQTHQTFPLHAYPWDYFRFSVEALSGIFNPKMGMKVLPGYTGYQFPCQVMADKAQHCKATRPAYLNVCLGALKVGATPEEFKYDLEPLP